MIIPTLTTTRLKLRAFTSADIDPFHQIVSDRDVLRYFPNPNPPTRAKVEKMVAGQLEHWAKHNYGWWAAEPHPKESFRAEPHPKESFRAEPHPKESFSGWCGLQYLPETDEVEVAYMLGKPYWGQGLATEAGQAALDYGFKDLALQSIVGIVHIEHKASQRVLEKLGLEFAEQKPYFGMECYRYVIECPMPYASVSSSG